jgi:FMN phosphatase YigB (HAD superfamily)
LSINASKAVFVGDMIDLDIKGPKSIGIKAVLIERRPMKTNADVKPDFVIKNLPELFDVLEGC